MIFLVCIYPYNDGDGIYHVFIDTGKLPAGHPVADAIDKAANTKKIIEIDREKAFDSAFEKAKVKKFPFTVQGQVWLSEG